MINVQSFFLLTDCPPIPFHSHYFEELFITRGRYKAWILTADVFHHFFSWWEIFLFECEWGKTLWEIKMYLYSFSLAYSPSRNDGFPVITSVCSLSAGALSTLRYGFVLFGSLNMCFGTVTLGVNSVFCALQSKKETACYSTEHTKKISDKWLPQEHLGNSPISRCDPTELSFCECR